MSRQTHIAAKLGHYVVISCCDEVSENKDTLAFTITGYQVTDDIQVLQGEG